MGNPLKILSPSTPPPPPLLSLLKKKKMPWNIRLCPWHINFQNKKWSGAWLLQLKNAFIFRMSSPLKTFKVYFENQGQEFESLVSLDSFAISFSWINKIHPQNLWQKGYGWGEWILKKENMSDDIWNSYPTAYRIGNSNNLIAWTPDLMSEGICWYSDLLWAQCP